jgi:hypothetical protein
MAADAPKRFAAARAVLRILRRAFTPVALLALGFAVYAARDTLAELAATAAPAGLALAVVLWASLNLLVPAIAAAWLRGLGADVGYATLLDIHLRRLPARYLPGGVWHTVSRVIDLQARGVDRPRWASLVLMENAVPLAVALAMCGALTAIGGATGAGAAMAVLGAGVFIAAFALRARLFASAPTPPPATTAVAVAHVAVFWTIATLAFVVYWRSLPFDGPPADIVAVATAYLLGWTAGFVAVFAPQGIGVFETVAAWRLHGVLPLASTAAVVAGFRATTLVGDGLAWALGAAIRRLARRHDTSH